MTSDHFNGLHDAEADPTCPDCAEVARVAALNAPVITAFAKRAKRLGY